MVASPGTGAQRGLSGEQHRAAHVRFAANDEQSPEVALVGVAAALQLAKSIAGGDGDARPVEDSRRHVQVREQHVAGVVHRRAGDETDLVGDEGDGEVGAHRARRQ